MTTTTTADARTEAGLAPVAEDMGIFLIAGRTKNPALALTQGEEAERLGFRRAWLSEFALYGSNPRENATLIDAWRNRT